MVNSKTWPTTAIPFELIDFIVRREKASLRKARLLAVALCREHWKRLPTAAHRRLVEALEAYVEGEASWRDVLHLRATANEAYDSRFASLPFHGNPTRFALHCSTIEAASQTLRDVLRVYSTIQPIGTWVYDENEAVCGTIRCVFRNPFTKLKWKQAWVSDTVRSLARVMYETRDFTAMPILADALQEAGCENEEVLAHCRDPKGVHVRGCWVVDLVLGKG